MKPILVLLPSLHRPLGLAQSVASLTVNGKGLHDILTISGDGGATKALNSVPMELLAQYEIVGLFNDDTRMQTAAWDELVLERMKGKAGLLYGRDGIQNEHLCTHPFISSRIIQVLGFVQPSILYHYYGDNFWMELLGPLGAVEYCQALFTEHFNAICRGLPTDTTTVSSMAHWESDSAAWLVYRDEVLPALRERVRVIL